MDRYYGKPQGILSFHSHLRSVGSHHSLWSCRHHCLRLCSFSFMIRKKDVNMYHYKGFNICLSQFCKFLLFENSIFYPLQHNATFTSILHGTGVDSQIWLWKGLGKQIRAICHLQDHKLNIFFCQCSEGARRESSGFPFLTTLWSPSPVQI